MTYTPLIIRSGSFSELSTSSLYPYELVLTNDDYELLISKGTGQSPVLVGRVTVVEETLPTAKYPGKLYFVQTGVNANKIYLDTGEDFVNIVTGSGDEDDSSTTDLTNKEAFTINQGFAVYISGVSQCKLASSTDPTKRNIFGFAYENIDSNTSGKIITTGAVSFSNVGDSCVEGILTPGSTYYLATNGQITKTKPATPIIVGIAISTTVLHIDLQNSDVVIELYEELDTKSNVGHTHSFNDLTDIPASQEPYVHPATHPASMIVEDENNNFVTSTQLTKIDNAATESYVATQIANLVDTAPSTLNTLNELAAALGDDANFATTVTTALGNKVDKVIGKDLSTNDFTDELETKLNNLANYEHPATHPAFMITEDSTHRFVTDAEKTTWNNKASTVVATPSADGLMSSTDKTKLDGLGSGGNYTLPVADSDTLGGVKAGGNNITIDVDGTIHAASGGYTLPTMTDSVKGGALLGSTLEVVADVLNVKEDVSPQYKIIDHGSISANINIDVSAAPVQKITVDAAIGITFTNWNTSSGYCRSVVLILINPGTNVTLSGIKWNNGTAPTFTTTGEDRVMFESCDNGTNIYGFVVAQNMS